MRLIGGNPQRGKGTGYLQLNAKRASPVIVGLSGCGDDGHSCQPRSDCGSVPQHGTVFKHELTFSGSFSNYK